MRTRASRIRSRRAACWILTFLVTACAGSPPAPRPEPAAWRLPDDWDTCAAVRFETLAQEALPATQPTRIDPADRELLGEALATPGQRAVRAAVLLARSATPETNEILLARLEQRHAPEARNADAADVVSAAALAGAAEPAGALAERRARLVALASGATAHPDLEVRVECAASAVALGSDEPLAFLIQVLRIGTPRGAGDVRDFEVSPTTAWARGRAARALSARAGIPVVYRTDAPLHVRTAEADRLAELLGLAETNAAP